MVIPVDFLVAGGFYTFALIAIIGAIGVVAAERVFHSALFLVLALGGVAGVFIVLGADFLGAVEILVYVGAIMVLILFGIMLTPQHVQIPETGGPARVVSALVVSGAVFLLSLAVFLTSRWPNSTPTPSDVPSTPFIASGLLYTYAFPFELASVLLLIAMIGAIVIAREP
ncbi:MAG: hypothetical protein QOF51_3058 [Chloroflexota bacterium]|nr:hypothetical protein [Chloroflexota bacterium]